MATFSNVENFAVLATLKSTQNAMNFKVGTAREKLACECAQIKLGSGDS